MQSPSFARLESSRAMQGTVLQEYAPAGDYSIMINRFKLLNLVQQLAHQDVMEMIDAVGLDALQYKTTSDRWRRHGGFSDGESDGESPKKQRLTDTRRDRKTSLSNRFRKDGSRGVQTVAASRSNRDRKAPIDSRTRTIKFSETQEELSRDSYFSRLANPRSRGPVTPTKRSGIRKVSHASQREKHVHDDSQNTTAEYHTPSDLESGIALPLEPGVSGKTIQSAHREEEDRRASPRTMGPPVLQDSLSPLSGASRATSASPSGPGPQRAGRGLAPKPKPKGAAQDTTVPMSVLREAAAAVRATKRIEAASKTSTSSAPDLPFPKHHGVLHPDGSRGELPHAQTVVVSREGSPMLEKLSPEKAVRENSGLVSQNFVPDVAHLSFVAPSTETSPSEATLPQMQNSLPLPPSEGTPEADKLVALINSMLQAQEEALHAVARDLEVEGEIGKAEVPKTGSKLVEDGTTMEKGTNTGPPLGFSRSGEIATYLEDAVLADSDDDGIEGEYDAALVRSRMERRIRDMEKEITEVAAHTEALGEKTELPISEPIKFSHRRLRGTIPEAMRKRLLTARKEMIECITYNERQWNTSSISQFTFASRLTNTLAEDGFQEIFEEVVSIMDEYVDGLVDHELQ